MSKYTKIILVIILAIPLLLIRGFENAIFYDPLLEFFKSTQADRVLPEMNTFKLLSNIAMRYLMNTIISLAILWVLFQEKSIIKLSILLYIVLFICLMLVFVFLLYSSEKGSFMTLFYIRRFLIQPLLLLVLVPAFYFQKRT